MDVKSQDPGIKIPSLLDNPLRFVLYFSQHWNVTFGKIPQRVDIMRDSKGDQV